MRLSDISLDDVTLALATRLAASRLSGGFLTKTAKQAELAVVSKAAADFTIDSALQNTGRNALIGAGVGAAANTIKGLLDGSSKRRIKTLDDLLSGALVGGAVGGAGTLAYNTIPNMFPKPAPTNDKSLKEQAQDLANQGVDAATETTAGHFVNNVASGGADRLREGAKELINTGDVTEAAKKVAPGGVGQGLGAAAGTYAGLSAAGKYGPEMAKRYWDNVRLNLDPAKPFREVEKWPGAVGTVPTVAAPAAAQPENKPTPTPSTNTNKPLYAAPPGTAESLQQETKQQKPTDGKASYTTTPLAKLLSGSSNLKLVARPSVNNPNYVYENTQDKTRYTVSKDTQKFINDHWKKQQQQGRAEAQAKAAPAGRLGRNLRRGGKGLAALIAGLAASQAPKVTE